ncbi:MAG: serine hydrolase [Ferruginibacter sp.]
MRKISIVFISFCFCLTAKAQMPAADSLLDFIATHKKNAALFLVKNDTVLAKLNENKVMPLASTVKMLVAVEFAKQAAAHVLNPAAYVALADLDKYYLPNTDGNAHPAWLKYEKSLKHISNDSVRLLDVARGMMMFSSNANTEYIMELVGLDNVKNNIQLLGLQPHTAVYPLVASLFVYQNPKNKSEESILKGIKKLNDQTYARLIYDIHKALTYNPELKAKFRPQDLTPNMQKLWSDRLPASTVKSYARLAKTINNRKFFDEQTYAVLSDILETVMENPANQKQFLHIGMKGGSTASVLTKCVYAATKGSENMHGNHLELVYFFNDLSLEENGRLQKWMNAFEYMSLTSNSFRQKISATIK